MTLDLKAKAVKVFNDIVNHMNVETAHAYRCGLADESDHILEALQEVQDATRRETINEIMENFKTCTCMHPDSHDPYCRVAYYEDVILPALLTTPEKK